MSRDNEEFFVTVYGRGGHDELMETTEAVKAKGLSCRITQGALSVWGPWSSYETFAAVIDKYPRLTVQGTPSVCRAELPENPMRNYND